MLTRCHHRRRVGSPKGSIVASVHSCPEAFIAAPPPGHGPGGGRGAPESAAILAGGHLRKERRTVRYGRKILQFDNWLCKNTKYLL